MLCAFCSLACSVWACLAQRHDASVCPQVSLAVAPPMWVAFCAVASSRRLQPFYPKHTFHLKESPFPVAWGGGVPSRRPAARQSAPSPVGSHAAPAQEGCEEGPSGLWGERQPPPSAASFPSSCSSCSSLFVLFFKTFLIQN